MMKEKIFILGVGAQKCGTTWVQDYLGSSSRSDFGFTKEYHYFDALHSEECECFYSMVVKDVIEQLESENTKVMSNNNAIQKLAFFSNPDLYYAYFTDLLSRDGITITGDFTPSYSGLSVDTFRTIKEQFKLRGVRVVPIFLMRDPVVRLQSMARMALKRLGDEPSYERELAKIQRLHLSEQDMLRSNYPKTIESIESVFGDDCFIGFYENLFSKEEMNRLCDLLGLDFIQPDFDKKVNVNKTQNKMPETLLTELRSGYEHVYSYCEQKYGQQLIDNLWLKAA